MVIEFWEKKLLYRNWLGFNWKCWITLQPLVPSFFVSSPLSLRNHYFFKLWVSHITKLSIQVWNKIIALIIIEVHQFFIYCLFNWNKKKYFQIFHLPFLFPIFIDDFNSKYLLIAHQNTHTFPYQSLYTKILISLTFSPPFQLSFISKQKKKKRNSKKIG